MLICDRPSANRVWTPIGYTVLTMERNGRAEQGETTPLLDAAIKPNLAGGGGYGHAPQELITTTKSLTSTAPLPPGGAMSAAHPPHGPHELISTSRSLTLTSRSPVRSASQGQLITLSVAGNEVTLPQAL